MKMENGARIVENANSSHTIFLRKQHESLTIVDPTIGLLEAEGDSYSLMERLLLFYGRNNENVYLEAHALELNRKS